MIEKIKDTLLEFKTNWGKNYCYYFLLNTFFCCISYIFLLLNRQNIPFLGLYPWIINIVYVLLFLFWLSSIGLMVQAIMRVYRLKIIETETFFCIEDTIKKGLAFDAYNPYKEIIDFYKIEAIYEVKTTKRYLIVKGNIEHIQTINDVTNPNIYHYINSVRLIRTPQTENKVHRLFTLFQK